MTVSDQEDALSFLRATKDADLPVVELARQLIADLIWRRHRENGGANNTNPICDTCNNPSRPGGYEHCEECLPIVSKASAAKLWGVSNVKVRKGRRAKEWERLHGQSYD